MFSNILALLLILKLVKRSKFYAPTKLSKMHYESVNKWGQLNLLFEYCYEEIHCINTCNIVILSIYVLNSIYILRKIN